MFPPGMKDYYIKKLTPSPVAEDETIKGRFMKKGDEIKIFNTDFGKFVVLICLDFERKLHLVFPDEGVPNLDLIIVPQRNRAIKQFQKIGDVVCVQGSCPYVIQSNAARIGSDSVGGTCIIGMENRDIISGYIEDGTRPKERVEYQSVEAKEGDNLFIVELDIKNKGIKWPVQKKMELIGFYPL